MSIIIASKLKYPDSLIKEKEISSENKKDHTNLLKQMKNIKLTKYSKLLGKNIQSIEVAVEKLRENKKCFNIPKAKETLKSRNESLPKKEVSVINNPAFDINMDEPIEVIDQDCEDLKTIREKNKKPKLNMNLIRIPIGDIKLELLSDKNTITVDSNTITANESTKNSKIKSIKNEINFNNMLDYMHQLISYPQYSTEYLSDIFYNLKAEEKQMIPQVNYLEYQNDLNEKMRAILIDWLVEVHYKFKLTTETLFLAVNIIDRYLSLKVIGRNQLQLVGVAGLLIASKYEEIYSPDIRDFEYITDQGYDKNQILKIETEILKVLEFNVTMPSSFRFYEIISTCLLMTKEEFYFGRYLLELFLLDYRSIYYSPSLIATCACFLSLNALKNTDYPNNLHIFSSLKEFVDLNSERDDKVFKNCCKDICFIFDNIDNAQLHSVKKKFSTAELLRVSKLISKSLIFN